MKKKNHQEKQIVNGFAINNNIGYHTTIVATKNQVAGGKCIQQLLCVCLHVCSSRQTVASTADDDDDDLTMATAGDRLIKSI